VLDDASSLVRHVARRTWVDANGDLTDVPHIVVSITASVARRMWDNPTGAVHETAGPFSVRRSEQAGDVMYLTKTERSVLESMRPTSAVWTLSTQRADEGVAPVNWFEVEGALEPGSTALPREPW
jgi:hypothetical protein